MKYKWFDVLLESIFIWGWFFVLDSFLRTSSIPLFLIGCFFVFTGAIYKIVRYAE